MNVGHYRVDVCSHCLQFQKQSVKMDMFVDAVQIRVGQAAIHTLNIATQAWRQVGSFIIINVLEFSFFEILKFVDRG